MNKHLIPQLVCGILQAEANTSGNKPDRGAFKKRATGQSESNMRMGDLVLRLHSGMYHDVYEKLIEKHGTPDAIFAPNAGLAAYPSWVDTVVRPRIHKL